MEEGVNGGGREMEGEGAGRGVESRARMEACAPPHYVRTPREERPHVHVHVVGHGMHMYERRERSVGRGCAHLCPDLGRRVRVQPKVGLEDEEARAGG